MNGGYEMHWQLSCNHLRTPSPGLLTLLSKIKQQSQSSQLFPPSIKPELLETTFALFVHTYCELLECGLEQTAHRLLSTYRAIHEPRYPSEFQDLMRVRSTAQLIQLSDWIEASNAIYSQVKKIGLKVEKLNKQNPATSTTSSSGGRGTSAAASTGSNSGTGSLHTHTHTAAALEEVNELKHKLAILTERHGNLNTKLQSYPFLKKAKSSRRHLNLSSITFGVLARFLKSQEELIYMSSMLQSK